MAYTKLFNSIVTSTIWLEDDRTRLVWITMLALADKHGEVMASIPGLARVAGVPVDDCRIAIAKFLSPDPDSRSKDDEGRRIEPIDGGWQLINHAKYRAMASREEQQEADTLRKQRYRARLSRNVPKCPEPVRENLHIAEADSDPSLSSSVRAAAAPPSAPKFVKPSLEAIQLQAAKIGLAPIEADKFFNHYEANGWRVGRNPMKSWTHAMANWKANATTYTRPPATLNGAAAYAIGVELKRAEDEIRELDRQSMEPSGLNQGERARRKALREQVATLKAKLGVAA